MKRCLAAVGLAMCGVSAASGQNLLVNGGFEDADPFAPGGFPVDTTTVEPWVLINGVGVDGLFDVPTVPPFEGDFSLIVGGFDGNAAPAQFDHLWIQTVSEADAGMDFDGKTFRVSTRALSPQLTGPAGVEDLMLPLVEVPADDPETPDVIETVLQGNLTFFQLDFLDEAGASIGGGPFGVQLFEGPLDPDNVLIDEDPGDVWVISSGQITAPAGTDSIEYLALRIQFTPGATGLLFVDDIKLVDVDTLATPEDWNDDGLVDGADVVDLVQDMFPTAFADSDAADLDGDGVGNTIFDLLDFVADVDAIATF